MLQVEVVQKDCPVIATISSLVEKNLLSEGAVERAFAKQEMFNCKSGASLHDDDELFIWNDFEHLCIQ